MSNPEASRHFPMDKEQDGLTPEEEDKWFKTGEQMGEEKKESTPIPNPEGNKILTEKDTDAFVEKDNEEDNKEMPLAA